MNRIFLRIVLITGFNLLGFKIVIVNWSISATCIDRKQESRVPFKDIRHPGTSEPFPQHSIFFIFNFQTPAPVICIWKYVICSINILIFRLSLAQPDQKSVTIAHKVDYCRHHMQQLCI